MTSNGKRRNSELFMVQLLSGAPIEKCATAAQISLRTAYRWWANEKFQAQYRQRSKRMLERATQKLIDSLDESIDGLRELSKDAAQPGSSRVSAFLGLLKQGFSNSALIDIEQRIALLEEQRKGNHNPNQEE